MLERNDDFFDDNFEIIEDVNRKPTDVFSYLLNYAREHRKEEETEKERQRRLDIEDTRSIFPSRKGENTYTYSVFAPNSRKLSGLMKDFYKKGIKYHIISDERYGNEHTITYEIYN